MRERYEAILIVLAGHQVSRQKDTRARATSSTKLLHIPPDFNTPHARCSGFRGRACCNDDGVGPLSLRYTTDNRCGEDDFGGKRSRIASGGQSGMRYTVVGCRVARVLGLEPAYDTERKYKMESIVGAGVCEERRTSCARLLAMGMMDCGDGIVLRLMVPHAEVPLPTIAIPPAMSPGNSPLPL